MKSRLSTAGHPGRAEGAIRNPVKTVGAKQAMAMFTGSRLSLRSAGMTVERVA
jgi:hypothetical protein